MGLHTASTLQASNALLHNVTACLLHWLRAGTVEPDFQSQHSLALYPGMTYSISEPQLQNGKLYTS